MHETIQPCSGAPIANSNGASNHLELRLQELTAENESLRAEVAQTRIERDDYLKALYKLAPEYMFTAEEIEDMMTNGVDGRELLAEIEAMVKEGS